MLAFRLFGFPVRIHWMFWILCLILGMPYLQMEGPVGLGRFVLVSVIVTGSILWHELGHAWARKRSGASHSEILLYGFGGLCSGPGRFSRGQSIFIAAAGPLASLALGMLAWIVVLKILASTLGISNEWLGFVVGWMLWVNVGWAILNLFPILPLDGGHILAGIVGPRGAPLVLKVSFGLSLCFALAGLIFLRSLFTAAMFGMLAYSNWQQMQGLRTRRY